MDVKSRNGKNNRIFFELFRPPCRNALADFDGSAPECAQVCALHTGPHLASVRKIEMVAVRKGAGSYLAGMAVAIPILNVDGRRHTNNFSKNI